MIVQAAAPTRPRPVSTGRATVLVLGLMLALTLSFIDRQIVALLVEPIKRDLGLSDTQFGLLQGLAFALFYIGLGIPIGRLADRGNRRNLVVTGVALWSVMTAACGTARGFLSLFAWRAGVGIGEAALSPAGYSMIADAVPKRRLSLALGVFSMGVYLGSGLALMIGGALLRYLARQEASVGALHDVSPWRLVFVAVGLPGLVVALLFLLLVREPERTNFDPAANPEMPSAAETARFVIGERRLFGGMILGFACHNSALYALLGWIPAFLGRTYGLATAQVGAHLGLPTMLGGVAGLILGGLASDRLFAGRRSDGPLLIGIASMAGVAVMTIVTLRSPTADAASWTFAVVMLFLALPIGGAAAALQLVVPNRFRGQVSALYLTTISLVGLTIGPVLPPVLSDFAFRDAARIGDGLGIAVCGAAAVAILFFLLGRPAYARRYAEVHIQPIPETSR